MDGDRADKFVQEMQTFDAVIMGGNTYEFGFSYGLKPGEPAYLGLKHHVLATRFDVNSGEQVERISHDGVERIKEKNEVGKPIWLCGGRLAGKLLREGIIDELKIKGNPFSLDQRIG